MVFNLFLLDLGTQIGLIILGVVVLVVMGFIILFARAHHKVPQGRALVRTGFGGTLVEYDSGMFVIPILHRVEEMDISLKTIEVHRAGGDGLVCKDNLRADIKVVFFVRVNKDPKTILEVAQTISCARASDPATLSNLFDAKFSEALKTVGRQFDFEDLYTERDSFKKQILNAIGQDLNGYILDDCAIDYLEQTPLNLLRAENILDAEGIRKIEQITSIKAQETNAIRREKEKTIKKQDVDAREAILQLELQQKEKEERQKRAVAELTSTQYNEAQMVISTKEKEAKLKEIENEQEVGKATENKDREILVARKNKERTEAVETQRVETDRELEIERRERAVGEMRYDKQKALENKNREIQAVIKERKAEEKKTIEEEQRILELQQVSEADRSKKVTLIKAQQDAESLALKLKTEAETSKITAEMKAQQVIIEANADKEKSIRHSEARKIEADAKSIEESTLGIAEANVMNAKTEALEKQGMVEAKIYEAKATAEAKGIELKAESNRKKGLAEIEVQTNAVDVKSKEGNVEAAIMEAKATAEAKGLEQKANAMKLLDGVGKDHEEFKLRLEQQKQIQLAEINANRQIAESQAIIMSEALKNAKIDIVGGETQFFDTIINAISRGKSFERVINNSPTLLELKESVLGADNSRENVLDRVQQFMKAYGISSETVKNLTISAVLSKIYAKANQNDQSILSTLLNQVAELGIGSEKLK